MVALVRARRLDLSEHLPEEARVLIKDALDREPSATRKVYAALAQKIWMLLVERRLDGELGDWHHLLGAVRAAVRPTDEAVAERLTALADLLRQSISLAETSPVREIAQRPRARAVLGRLAIEGGFVRRQHLLDTLGLGSSNLSNTLTDLVTLGLIERRDDGKHAEFRLTPFGREIMAGEAAAAEAEPAPAKPRWNRLEAADKLADLALPRVLVTALSADVAPGDEGAKLVRFRTAAKYIPLRLSEGDLVRERLAPVMAEHLSWDRAEAHAPHAGRGH